MGHGYPPIRETNKFTSAAIVGRRPLVIGGVMKRTRSLFAKSDDGTSFPGRHASRETVDH